MLLVVATDGSAINNPHGPAGWAWYVSDTQWASGGFTKASNQYAELFAILAALRGLPKDVPLVIRTDSQYSIDCLTKWIKGWKRNGWKTRSGDPVKNADVIRMIDQTIASRSGDVRFEKVKGHAGDHANERADTLCGNASRAVQGGRPVLSGPGWAA